MITLSPFAPKHIPLLVLLILTLPSAVSAQLNGGCTYPGACNFDAEANVDDGSCIFPEPNYDCEGNCLLDLNNNGLCDLEEVAGCINLDAINYNPDATLDDGSCIITCKGDFNNDGFIDVNDLLSFLAALGNYCSGAGCMDPVACNFDPEATFDLGYCQYPEQYYSCEGLPINDADGDGVPDEMEVAGCTDPEAVNYNPLATDEDESCQYQGEDHSCGASSVHNPDLIYGAVTDIDGNTYRTIVIGDQEWMAENLNVSRYANGEVIPNITITAQWVAQTQGAWCYFNNHVQYACPSGKLYNWYVILDERNVCPTGWHVPSDAEWTELTDYLGGEVVAGGKMKSLGNLIWNGFNAGATNESGFSGLPGGERASNGDFYSIGLHGSCWSSTEDGAQDAWYRMLNFNNANVHRNSYNKEGGLSIRCIRD